MAIPRRRAVMRPPRTGPAIQEPDYHVAKLKYIVTNQIATDDALNTNATSDADNTFHTDKFESNLGKIGRLARDIVSRPKPSEHGNRALFNTEQKIAIRRLHANVVQLLARPVDDARVPDTCSSEESNKTSIADQAMKLADLLSGSGREKKAWMPQKFRELDILAPGYDKDYESSEEEEWVPEADNEPLFVPLLPPTSPSQESELSSAPTTDEHAP